MDQQLYCESIAETMSKNGGEYYDITARYLNWYNWKEDTEWAFMKRCMN